MHDTVPWLAQPLWNYWVSESGQQQRKVGRGEDSMLLFVSVGMSWCLMSSDVSWHIRDKLWPMPKHGSIILTSTETRRLVRTDSSGRPPRLSHSSWTMFVSIVSSYQFKEAVGHPFPKDGCHVHSWLWHHCQRGVWHPHEFFPLVDNLRWG